MVRLVFWCYCSSFVSAFYSRFIFLLRFSVQCICVPRLFSVAAYSVQEDIDLTNCLFLTNKQCKPDNKLPKHLTFFFFARYALCCVVSLFSSSSMISHCYDLWNWWSHSLFIVKGYLWFCVLFGLGPLPLMRDQRYWFTFQFVKMWFNGFRELGDIVFNCSRLIAVKSVWVNILGCFS